MLNVGPGFIFGCSITTFARSTTTMSASVTEALTIVSPTTSVGLVMLAVTAFLLSIRLVFFPSSARRTVRPRMSVLVLAIAFVSTSTGPTRPKVMTETGWTEECRMVPFKSRRAAGILEIDRIETWRRKRTAETTVLVMVTTKSTSTPMMVVTTSVSTVARFLAFLVFVLVLWFLVVGDAEVHSVLGNSVWSRFDSFRLRSRSFARGRRYDFVAVFTG